LRGFPSNCFKRARENETSKFHLFSRAILFLKNLLKIYLIYQAVLLLQVYRCIGSALGGLELGRYKVINISKIIFSKRKKYSLIQYRDKR
jgi:hypothetical protein